MAAGERAKGAGDLAGKSLFLLLRLAEILEEPLEPEKAMSEALELMAVYMGIKRGAISEIDPVDGKIRITSAWGLRPDEVSAGQYQPGEGVTGNVIASGKPMCVRDVAAEPLFLNRTHSRDMKMERLSFSCVPIKHAGEIIGAIWMDKESGQEGELKADAEILRVIAALLAPLIYRKGGKKFLRTDLKLGCFIGESASMQEVCAKILQVAPSRATVLLHGESGTGKELAARAIHEGSHYAAGPFISLNCAALPENLVESELFGHERGAFTGAAGLRKGKFELAHKGTLFLDEIGEMSLAAQAKLLRVLQEHVVERVGGSTPIAVDVRVIAATNRDIQLMLEKGQFRSDLFYRLNVFPIQMPPLRERKEDVRLLAGYFLRKQARELHRPEPEISAEALKILNSYSWPGNIRELQNVLERAMLLLEQDSPVLPKHLPSDMVGVASGEAGQHSAPAPRALGKRLDELERTAIVDALAASNGHIGNAARALGVTERILSLRLKRYGVNYRDFRKNGGFKGGMPGRRHG